MDDVLEVSDNVRKNKGFIAVHLGAGHHAVSKVPRYKKLCKKATSKGIEMLQNGVSILDAVVEVVSILENSSLTNAGFGSNVTDKGIVECDASVMEGKSQRYGAVGAVSCVKNPIFLAKELLIHQTANNLTHGRIPPAFLVAEGAREWALGHGIASVSQQEMLSQDVVKIYRKWREKLALSEKSKLSPKLSLEDVCNVSEEYKKEWQSVVGVINDTVGAVGIDASGQTVAAASSGGLMMKQSGRVGPAALFGSGCWAQQDDVTSIAASTSGCGESLIRTILARECCRVVQNKRADPSLAVQRLLTDAFLNSTFLSDDSERLAGSLVLIYDVRQRRGEVVLAHTTDSMCVGFMSSTDRKPKVRMSRLTSQSICGQSLVVEGSSIDLTNKS